MGAPWSLADDAVLKDGVIAGHSTNKIADGLSVERSLEAIETRASYLRRLGILPQAKMGRPRAPVREREQQPAVSPAPSLERPKSPHEPGWRPCLGGCGQTFWSEHAGNRICHKCEASVGRLGYTNFDLPSVVNYH